MMTTEQKRDAVVNYCERNGQPNQAVCPEVVQRWITSKGTMYWSNMTGRRTGYNPNTRYTVPVRGDYIGRYVYYVKELDALEISKLYMSGGRGVDGVPKEWKYASNHWEGQLRYFIFHNDTNVYMQSGDIHTTNKKYANDSLISNALHANNVTMIDESILETEVKKFDSNYKQEHHWGLWDLREWYRLSFMPRKKGKVMIDLERYELSDDVPQFDTNIIEESNYNINKLCWFDILDDEYAVIRVFEYNTGYDYLNRKYVVSKSRKEVFRIFIDKKGKPAVLCMLGGEWKRRSNPVRAWQGYVFANPEKISEWKPLKYIESCIDYDDRNCLENIITMLRHPIIESLIKSGYPKTAKRLLADKKVAAHIKEYFGIDKEAKGNVYKALGVNKYLLQKYEADIEKGNENRWSVGTNRYVIRAIKQLYNKTNVSDLSQESIDLVYPVLKEYDRFATQMFDNNHGYYHTDRDREISEDERNFFIRLCKMNKRSNSDVFNAYIDVIRLANTIRNMPEINIREFKNEHELIRLHDELLAIKEIEDAERRALYNLREKERIEAYRKKFEKLQPERIEKYEYTGEDFCIRMPKTLDEITREGSLLHHCVAGYREQHANGDTNIIFLRKTADDDIPFYTIEIRNGKVVQIHGSHNRWLGNNPEAIPFVYEWVNKIGVQCDKKMLLNKGAGYCASSENLPESYLYAKKGA